MNKNIEFFLPLGLIQDGKICRKGHMHLATTQDELDIQDEDDVGINTRFRDALLLEIVIDDLEGVSVITSDVIENLFEADYLYLQLLYKEINGETDTRIMSKCPQCEEASVVTFSGLYSDMNMYKESE